MQSENDFQIPFRFKEIERESIQEIDSYLYRLWPILRSITGNGVRLTHDILSEILPLKRIEVPSGTVAYDWTVPEEWVIRDAYVIDPDGIKILDIKENNLYLVNYSTAFSGIISKEELDTHLYSLPDKPDAIPYVTSYYERKWGFCISHKQRQNLKEGNYQVYIDAEHIQGSLTMSESVLPGKETKEVLISTYTCHPSMGNNELSGPLVASFLYKRLASIPERRYTYRFVFLPETIGSITYLSLHGDALKKNIEAGFVVSCIGNPSPFTYKKSRLGNSLADRVAIYNLSKYSNVEPLIKEFTPRGSDERQYCSPGFNLPVGVIARSIYHCYPEYHTSLDNLDFISAQTIQSSIDAYFTICMSLDKNLTYTRTSPYCEPQLGKKGLYPNVGACKKGDFVNALLWLLNLADGKNDLLSIAEISGVDYWFLTEVADKCIENDLIQVY
ncbi:DUF4910 domain-containing protein [Leptospira alexanderi]|uniref:DUF4910 domain-containing protein n=1 Tax=Leptospira alexanderi TaxID=100053 RepID=UPI000990ED04|nr:DUF4910 domain-containing protein [Leptospira alexanderi]